MVGENTDEQGNDTLDDESVTLCREMQQTVGIVALKPHSTLTSVDKITFRLVFLVERSLFIAQVERTPLLSRLVFHLLSYFK